MLNRNKRLTAALVSLAIGLGAGSIAIGAAADGHQGGNADDMSVGSIIEDAIDFSSGPVQCQILASSKDGRMVLESVVHAEMPVTGSYVLQVASVGGPNRSRIQQGGNFAADLDEATTLNKLMLGSHGASYDVSLKLSVNGTFVECAEKIAA